MKMNQKQNGCLIIFLQQVPSITTLLYTINPKWNDTIYDLNPGSLFWQRIRDRKAGRVFIQDRAKILFSNQYQTGGKTIQHYPGFCRA